MLWQHQSPNILKLMREEVGAALHAGHTRLATTSNPTKTETHPHQWTPSSIVMHWRTAHTSPEEDKLRRAHAASADSQHSTIAGKENTPQPLQIMQGEQQQQDTNSTERKRGVLSLAMKWSGLSEESYEKQRDMDSAFDVRRSAKQTAGGAADSSSPHDVERDVEAGMASAARPQLLGVRAFGGIFLVRTALYAGGTQSP